MNTKNPAPAKNQAQAASLYPNKPGFKPAKPVVVGGEILMNAPIEYNTGRKTVKLVVRNTGDRRFRSVRISISSRSTVIWSSTATPLSAVT